MLEQSPRPTAFASITEASQNAGQAPGINTPSWQVDGEHESPPGTASFKQVSPDANAFEQSPRPTAFASTAEASQNTKHTPGVSTPSKQVDDEHKRPSMPRLAHEAPWLKAEEQSPISTASGRSSEASHNAPHDPAVNTKPSPQVDAVQWYPGLAVFVQEKPLASSNEQSPRLSAFGRSADASQAAGEGGGGEEFIV